MEAGPYILSQLAGAFAASALLLAITPHEPHNLGQTLPGRGVHPRAALAVEIILTLVLMYAILAVVAAKPSVQALGGLIIGVGEKVAEVYWGPLVGGAIENWFAYVLALAFLLVRPQGLFGEKIIERV